MSRVYTFGNLLTRGKIEEFWISGDHLTVTTMEHMVPPELYAAYIEKKIEKLEDRSGTELRNTFWLVSSDQRS